MALYAEKEEAVWDPTASLFRSHGSESLAR